MIDQNELEGCRIRAVFSGPCHFDNIFKHLRRLQLRWCIRGEIAVEGVGAETPRAAEKREGDEAVAAEAMPGVKHRAKKGRPKIAYADPREDVSAEMMSSSPECAQCH